MKKWILIVLLNFTGLPLLHAQYGGEFEFKFTEEDYREAKEKYGSKKIKVKKETITICDLNFTLLNNTIYSGVHTSSETKNDPEYLHKNYYKRCFMLGFFNAQRPQNPFGFNDSTFYKNTDTIKVEVIHHKNIRLGAYYIQKNNETLSSPKAIQELSDYNIIDSFYLAMYGFYPELNLFQRYKKGNIRLLYEDWTDDEIIFTSTFIFQVSYEK